MHFKGIIWGGVREKFEISVRKNKNNRGSARFIWFLLKKKCIKDIKDGTQRLTGLIRCKQNIFKSGLISGWYFLTLGIRLEEFFKKWQQFRNPIFLPKIFSHPDILIQHIANAFFLSKKFKPPYFSFISCFHLFKPLYFLRKKFGPHNRTSRHKKRPTPYS